MNSENAVFGRRIRYIREYQKLSREKLSEMANISNQFLADIETGKKGMSAVTLMKICDALHVSADSIIYGYESHENPEINIMLSRVPDKKADQLKELIELVIKMI